ncbi:hypothetical protein, partial [Xanthomonas hortorum]|uniref:hypothetical protein n=1 Tax=Xanthomonas hortorum TaxID=56454 RepID=UPI001CA4A004
MRSFLRRIASYILRPIACLLIKSITMRGSASHSDRRATQIATLVRIGRSMQASYDSVPRFDKEWQLSPHAP